MLISVFTPTFNRADLIHRVFDSLCAQDFFDFEWIILDDGSTDCTIDVVSRFRDQAKFNIKIYHRENCGKAQSINDGVDLAEGELFICFDSDDWCTSNALARIADIWNGLTVEEKEDYTGISCLKQLQDGTLIGEDYTRMRLMGKPILTDSIGASKEISGRSSARTSSKARAMICMTAKNIWRQNTRGLRLLCLVKRYF